MGNRRFVTWAARLALLLASLTICLVLVEVVARLASEQPDWAPPPAVPADLADAKVYETVFQLLRRNAKGLHKGLPYRTNSVMPLELGISTTSLPPVVLPASASPV